MWKKLLQSTTFTKKKFHINDIFTYNICYILYIKFLKVHFMKKTYLSVALVIALGGSMLFTSCIGQFALSNKVLDWNKQVGSKFVNELVFFAFWVLPVYEVTMIADLLIINSIEFWSGSNPLSASTKVIDTENGRYLVDCDGKGYTIKSETTDEVVRLDFDQEEQTWSVNIDDKQYPFMTFVDDSHVKMITPNGDFQEVELNEQGVLAYSEIVSTQYMAQR